MSTTLGERVLDATLRRVRSTETLQHDLVLVRDHPALRELSASAVLVGEPWRVERVTGELTLRDALPDTGRLVAILPSSFVPPLDIAGRAWLGKPLDVRADDVVAALTGRPCEPLPDDDIAEAVVAGLDLLARRVGRWSQHGVVSASEVRAVLVAAELGTDERLDRERDYALLARWILERAPQSRTPTLLARALEEAFPRTGRWLAWVARTGDVPALIAAGAVATEGGPSPVEPAPRTTAERQELRGLVDLAVREAWKVDEERTRAALVHAEQLFHRLRIPEDQAARYPLVRAALDRALHAFALRAAAGAPAEDALIEGLRANLHASAAGEAIEQVRDLARIARALRLEAPASGTWEDWARFGRDQSAWLDLLLRRVRRRLELVSPDQRAASEALLDAALARRDAWNRGFAAVLSAEWPRVVASKDLRRPLPLHHVSRSLVSRLLDAGRRVLLVVLDGCDLSTFIELCEGLPEGVGLVLPATTDPTLRAELESTGAFHVGIAPLPTVTSHARRALFAGEIPGNTALDDTEEATANSTADKIAFGRNAALRDTPRQLLLKGDLSQSGALVDALMSPTLRLVAVVFNGVDDALSSKETTAMGPWAVSSLGVGAGDALRVAIELDWAIVVTADHGHTPYVSPQRKVATKARAARYHDESLPASTPFQDGPLPSKPLYLLTAVGQWAGPQHRGFHGGAGLEEVLVPLAMLGRGQGRPRPPGWWWSSEAIEVVVGPPSSSEPAPPAPPRERIPPEIRVALAAQPPWIAALEHLAEHEVLSLAQLASLVGRPAFIMGGMMSRIGAELARAGLSVPFTEDPESVERVYRWRRTV